MHQFSFAIKILLLSFFLSSCAGREAQSGSESYKLVCEYNAPSSASMSVLKDVAEELRAYSCREGKVITSFSPRPSSGCRSSLGPYFFKGEIDQSDMISRLSVCSPEAKSESSVDGKPTIVVHVDRLDSRALAILDGKISRSLRVMPGPVEYYIHDTEIFCFRGEDAHLLRRFVMDEDWGFPDFVAVADGNGSCGDVAGRWFNKAVSYR